MSLRFGGFASLDGAANRSRPSSDSAAIRSSARQGGWAPYRNPDRPTCFAGLDEWLREPLVRHRGNAAVVHQGLSREHGIEVTLRTVQRAVQPFRQLLVAEACATVRFETRAGKQLQADFGQATVFIGGVKTRCTWRC